jgi:hypothetical protein
MSIGEEVLVGQRPNNCMFPLESEVVFNTVLCISALAQDLRTIK